MSAESWSALAIGGVWVLAGVASTARPRLQLGRYFVLSCWLLGAMSMIGAAAAAFGGVVWPATWLVWIGSAAVLTARVRTSRHSVAAASAEGRAVLRLLAVGLGVVALTIGGVGLLHVVVSWPARPQLVANGVILAFASMTVAMQVGGSRLGGDRWLWVLCAFGVAAGSAAASVSLFHLLLGDLDTDRLGPGEASAAATLAGIATLVAVPPIVRAVNRRTQRGRPDADLALARLDALLHHRVPLDETVLQAAELMRSSLGLDQAEVWTVTDGALSLVAGDPHVTPRSVELDDTAKRVAGNSAAEAHGGWVSTWIPDLLGSDSGTSPGSDRGVDVNVAAVAYAGELRGMLVGRGAADADLAAELLQQIAQRLGPAMHSASLDASLNQSVEELRRRESELRASRERLVAAADTERARIERDLHDGAQQHLVAIGVNLQLAHGLIETDPERAGEIIAELSAVARTAAEELRSLSHGIYPQTLEDGGIGAALDQASRNRGAAEIRVVSSGLRRYPQEIEAAVYFVCNEAITNAIKHGGPAKIAVNLVGGADELVFEVIDDGEGFDVEQADGRHGLTNMADRLGAVDGAVEIVSGPSGTRVLGRVPVEAPSE